MIKTLITNWNYYHNELSLSLENGEEIFTKATNKDIEALENNKIPTYWNEVEKKEGVYSCWIDWE